MSVITFACPKCAAALKTSVPAAAGKKIKCPKCATIFPIPAPPADSAEPPVTTRPEPASPPPKARPDPTPESSEPTEIQSLSSLPISAAPAPKASPRMPDAPSSNQIILIDDDDDTEVLSVRPARDD